MEQTTKQTQHILALLNRGITITPIDALNIVGTMKLATRISELRAAGITCIQQTLVTSPVTGKKFMKYWINPQDRNKFTTI